MVDLPARYPHLDPALLTLTGYHLAFWGDARERQRSLEMAVTAWESGDGMALQEAVGRVDGAVIAGLAALGLPRGPIGQVDFAARGRGWQARKMPNCDLIFDAALVLWSVREGRITDDVVRAWVHESIHARQPFEPEFRMESALAAGYEEGMAEGLARVVTRDRAGMAIVEQSYNGYVVAYRALAEVLGIPADTLWRRLWSIPPGKIRASFVDVLGQAWPRAVRGPVTPARHHRIQVRADTVFATTRAGEREVDPSLLRDGWARVLE